MKPLGDPKQIFWHAMGLMCKPEYKIDEENKSQIRNLVGLFSGTESDLDPQKGVILIGNPGSGKTMLLEVLGRLIRNTPQRFTTIACPSAVTEFTDRGEKVFQQWHGNYFFDDLGFEPVANSFTKRELMHDVIFDRYNKWRRSGVITHFTTNLSGDEIEARYGNHCISRLKQMCNVIGLGAGAESTDRRVMSMPVPTNAYNPKTFPKFFITEEEQQEQDELARVNQAYADMKNKPMEVVHKGLGSRLRDEWMRDHPGMFVEPTEEVKKDATNG